MKRNWTGALAWFLVLALHAEDPNALARKALWEGRLEEAQKSFENRLAQAPQDADALVGAGFTALRQNRLGDAQGFFQKATQLAPRYADAWYGLALIAERSHQTKEAADHLRKALECEPNRADFQEAKERLLPPPPSPLPPLQRPNALRLDFRVSRERGFEVRHGAAWKSLFLKGINLGAALPGKYPSEFPSREIYRQWIKEIAEVGFNCIRVYTIHPPHFYEELKAWNLSATKPIYLVHGVWTEPPPDDHFNDLQWFGPWKEEMARVVDLLHGRANLPKRPGHASGEYRADVSPWVLAYILGREWEPDNVVAYNEMVPGERNYQGRFLLGQKLHATEYFMAEAMEYMLAYEHDTYFAQRPMAFTNWPTLDPLTHPTESTKAEEIALRKQMGLPYEKGQKVNEYDNDAVGLDMEKYQDGPEAKAGFFASYHAYSYYPDFINLDPGYQKGRDHVGPNNYFAYLQDLVRHHRRHAVSISEFGVPSSRLVAHWQPQGMTHGGQNEREQGEHDARQFRNIHDSGCAGGMLFAWIDEWFKKNWLVIDFEEPLERKPFWYNVQDAEENYGLRGYHPGESGPTILIDGHSKDWDKVPVYLQSPQLTMKVVADEGWLHLGFFWKSEEGLDLERHALMVGLDTFDARLGDHRPPFGLPLTSEAGLEFVAVFRQNQGTLLVDEPYDLFTHRYSRPYRTVANDLGRFVMPRTESNRFRLGRDGTTFPEHRQEIGWLRFGTQDRSDSKFDSRAEWNRGPGFLEVRIPWGLLHLTDPSQRRVVQEDADQIQGAVGTQITEGFRLWVAAYEADEAFRPRTENLLFTLPQAQKNRIPLPPPFTWKTWEHPTFHTFRKQSFPLVQEALRKIPDTPQIPR